MKQITLLLSLGIVGWSGRALADDLPKPSAFARYESMMTRSPFAVATAAALPAPTPDFAKDLYIANAARSPDGDLVTLASSADKNMKKYLTTKAPVDGFSISNIEWSDKVGATKVTISKDGQSSTLTFNQALLSQPAANAPQLPQPPQQVTPTLPVPNPAPYTGKIQPAPIPMLPTPPPHVRGVIPRNPGVPAGAVPSPTAPAPAQPADL